MAEVTTMIPMTATATKWQLQNARTHACATVQDFRTATTNHVGVVTFTPAAGKVSCLQCTKSNVGLLVALK